MVGFVTAEGEHIERGGEGENALPTVRNVPSAKGMAQFSRLGLTQLTPSAVPSLGEHPGSDAFCDRKGSSQLP